MRRTLGKYHDSAGVKYSWDELQTNNNCCGQESYKDYLNVTLTKKKILVPESCCNYHKKEKVSIKFHPGKKSKKYMVLFILRKV